MVPREKVSNVTSISSFTHFTDTYCGQLSCWPWAWYGGNRKIEHSFFSRFKEGGKHFGHLAGTATANYDLLLLNMIYLCPSLSLRVQKEQTSWAIISVSLHWDLFQAQHSESNWTVGKITWTQLLFHVYPKADPGPDQQILEILCSFLVMGRGKEHGYNHSNVEEKLPANTTLPNAQNSWGQATCKSETKNSS